ncbi:MAG: toll/interleukin-1 receptor domain-containing protein [Terriglobales bacterium]
MPIKDMVFISHANPEDNDFTRWLALQLAKDGFGVWCDLTKLLGGENFWKDAEVAIRTRTIKFLYVLSRKSNVKDGPRNELQIAINVLKTDKSLQNFVVPLHIDDLPHSETNVLLSSINAVPFEKNWAKGYSQVLDLFERDNVPKNANFNPAAVSTWWKDQFSANRGLKSKAETYLSNLLPFQSMPESVWLHTLTATKPATAVEPEHRLAFAGFMDGIDLVTFAPATDIQSALGSSISLVESNSFPVCDLMKGKSALDAKKGRYFFSRLTRECWERWIAATGLSTYQLSGKGQCHFFRKQAQSKLFIPFLNAEGKEARRSVVGYATQADGSLRYWHFGIQARPVLSPVVGYLLSAHVIFSSDGVTPWSSHRKMHSARRRQCKTWFNPQWRDRLLATLNWLSQGNASLRIPVSADTNLELSLMPQQFESPVSYDDPLTRKEREDLLLPDLVGDTAVIEDDEQIEADDEEEFDSDDEEQQL